MSRTLARSSSSPMHTPAPLDTIGHPNSGSMGLPLFPPIDMDQTTPEPLVWSLDEESKAISHIGSSLAQQREELAQRAWITRGTSTLPSPKPETADTFATFQDARIESLFSWLMNEDPVQVVYTGPDPVLFGPSSDVDMMAL